MSASCLGNFDWSAERRPEGGRVTSVLDWFICSFAAGSSGGSLLEYHAFP